ncbi:MAG: hypothetical protein KAY37_01110 [Phycisphaerae bacterium]|nr:hypothetical protein [Phycisphaerae bacterium]
MILLLIVIIVSALTNFTNGIIAGVVSIPVLEVFSQATYDYLNTTLP